MKGKKKWLTAAVAALVAAVTVLVPEVGLLLDAVLAPDEPPAQFVE